MKVIVTAGPTVESIDPVRFISNRSTGTLGYEIAGEIASRGLETCLVSGPVYLDAPESVETVRVTSALEMKDAVISRIDQYDGIIMAAAVCDFRPAESRGNKIKKTEGLELELVRNPDILKEISDRKGIIRIGFALETDDPIENGRKKLVEKKLDMIVVNPIEKERCPFGEGRSLSGGKGSVDYTAIYGDMSVKTLKDTTKKQLASFLTDEMIRMQGVNVSK